MEIIKRGAEAILYLDSFEGKQVLAKERIKKSYRLNQIDESLRKFRTRKEVKLLTDARKVGVFTPQIFHVDESKSKIVMEYVDGKRIKELLCRADKKTAEEVCLDIGKAVGKLHSIGIVHGDLTTSNMILKDGKIFFIDFGLGEFSNKIEDQGIDLNLLYEAIKATHFKILKICWNKIFEGYKQNYKRAAEVQRKMEEIEKRGRYVER